MKITPESLKKWLRTTSEQAFGVKETKKSKRRSKSGILPVIVTPEEPSEYAIDGAEPGLVLDFEKEYYESLWEKPLADLLTHDRSGNATMVDSDGLIKWAPHNLLTYSDNINAGQWTATNVTINTFTQLTFDAADGSITRNLANIPKGKYTLGIVLSGSNPGDTFDLELVDTDGSDSSKTVVTVTNLPQTVSFTADMTAATFSGNLQVALNRVVGANSVTPGSTITIKRIWLFRSDLGGMVNNPDRGDSYVPTTDSARYLPRVGHHLYNGNAWVNEGLLHESEARTNFVEHSSDLTDAYWGRVSGNLFAGIVATNPTNETVSKFSVNAPSDNIRMYTDPRTPSTFSTFRFLAKADGISWIKSRIDGQGSFEGAYFDLSTGSIGTVDSGYTATIEDWGNGWYLCSTSVASATGQRGGLSLAEADGDVDLTGYSGSTSDGVLLTAFQWEDAPTRSSYIPTSGSTVTRAADTLTVPSANLPWPEPVVIGDEAFDSDTNNWSRGFFSVDGTLVYAGDTLTHTLGDGDTSGARWTLPVSCTVGNVLRLTVDALTTSDSGGIGITPNANGTGYSTSVSITDGETQVLVPATANPMYLTITTNGVAGDTTAATSVSVREIDPLSVSIQMDGAMTRAVENKSVTAMPIRWSFDGNNQIRVWTDSSIAGGGIRWDFDQEANNVIDQVSSGYIDPFGTNVPFNIASRHGSTFINGAADGVAMTANTTPVALPDLSATDLNLGYDYMGTIKTFRVWDEDLADEGIEEASAPSLEPSLSLIFDSTESSFIVEDWT